MRSLVMIVVATGITAGRTAVTTNGLSRRTGSGQAAHASSST
jgi:hypothetical protein